MCQSPNGRLKKVDDGGGVFVVSQDGGGDVPDIPGGSSNSVQPLHDANNSNSATHRFMVLPPWPGLRPTLYAVARILSIARLRAKRCSYPV